MKPSASSPSLKPGSSSWLTLILIGCSALASPGTAVAASPAGGVQPLLAQPSTSRSYLACPPPEKGYASCQAVIEPEGAQLDSFSPSVPSSAVGGVDGSGLAPAELQSAYDLPSSTAGSGQTVALVDAYDDPNAESDLAAYRSAYGLPACTKSNGCFRKVNQTGGTSYPEAEPGWDVEISLDIEMVSAACPNCHILLVEATSAEIADLTAAENEAAKLGATEISNSWASPEYSEETATDSAFTHPGIPITAASGDWGYDDHEIGADQPSYPASSPDVIAVGGTMLSRAENTRGWSEVVWPHSGSGCSLYEHKPSYQKDSKCSARMTNDVSAVAEDLSVYDSGQNPAWFPVGGTSAATPLVAAVEALSSSAARSLGAAAFYAHPSALFDVTSGENGSCGGSYFCTAGSSYDGPTGVGSPDGAFPSESGGITRESPAVAVSSVAPAEGPTGGGTTVTIKGTGFVKGATVTIGGGAKSVSVKSETELTAVTATHEAGSDEVIVSDKDGTSSSGPRFTYVAPPAPAVSSVTPAEGSTVGGTSITIRGTHLLAGAAIRIGGSVKSVTFKSETEVTAVTPAHEAGSDEVIVSDKNGTSSSGPHFTYVTPPAPTVSSITPADGSTAGGTDVTIKGSHFVKGAVVKIGTKAAEVTVKSETEITAQTPVHKAGANAVIVSDAGGASTSGPSFTYIAPAEVVVSSLTGVKLACTGEKACKGKLILQAAVSPAKGERGRTHTGAIGSATFSIPAEEVATIQLKLNGAGRALLSSQRSGFRGALAIETASLTPARKVRPETVTLDFKPRSDGRKASRTSGPIPLEAGG